ncbi:MAG TPA: DUF2934 domain-containing protein [Opitutaceae bacterium]|nr:DUF2934 domain-containing protein [Opitutaceae bacterium]
MISNSTSDTFVRQPTTDEIALRAHQIWVEQGCPHGHDVDNWLEAERQLRLGLNTTAPNTNLSGSVPPAEDVKTAEVAHDDEPYSGLRESAPIATKVEEELIEPGRPASRRSKTSIDL